MSEKVLLDWKPYLVEEDYRYLCQYIEDVNKPKNKIIVLYGSGSNGKTTLQDRVQKCVNSPLLHLEFEPIGKEDIVKIWEDMGEGLYTSSIVTTNFEQDLDNFPFVYIINMEHVFITNCCCRFCKKD